MMDIETKIKLHALCVQEVEQRIAATRQAIDTLQAAANQETKSSAGDKYETGRAMMQQEQDKAGRQLQEAFKLMKVLDELKPRQEHQQVQPGSLLITNHGRFYMTVSIGKIVLEGQDYMVISPVSPLAKQLTGLQAGAEISLNGRKFTVEQLV